MGLFEQFPYTNFHELNLDWIIQKVKEAYSPDNPPDMAVISVNGETGAVVLYKEAVVQLPAVDETTWNIFRKANGVDSGIQFINGQPAQRISGTYRYNIYDQGNPPPYPVTSIDGETGAVTTWANTGNSDITLPHEAEGDSWTLRREGPSGYLGIEFDMDESDNPSGFFILKPEGQTLQKVKILTLDDIPSEAGVVSINGEAGVVVLYAGDIKMASDDNTTIKQAIEGTQGLIVSDYDSSNSYSAGDFCLYLDTMYVCTGSTTGSWNPAKWTATSVAAELKSVKSKQATDESNISTLQGQMTTANTRIGQNEAIVAYPENDSTSSTNYSVGQYIVRNGSLYKVIANISAGDQFTGSNISAVDNLSHEVTALNSNFDNYKTQTSGTLNTNTYSSHNTVRVSRCTKQNGMVHLEVFMTFDSGFYPGTGTNIITIPSGFRISNDAAFPAMIQVNGGTWAAYTITVYASGEIHQSLTGTCSGLMFDIMYPEA